MNIKLIKLQIIYIYINSPTYFNEVDEHLPKHVGEFMYRGNL